VLSPTVIASLGDRLVGQLVDGIVGVIVVFATLPFARQLSDTPAISIALGIGYLLFGDGLPGGQSIGKHLVNTAVVDSKTDAPCTLLQSAIRNALGFFGVLDWVFIFTREHKRFGDMLAGTKVVYQYTLPPKAGTLAATRERTPQSSPPSLHIPEELKRRPPWWNFW
jgi:uncharacterized RDD family membrane protein YckC